MSELERCFVCLMSIQAGREVAVLVRTSVPQWERRSVCTPCGHKIKQTGEITVYSHDEWWTVRLQNGLEEAVEELAEGFE